MTEDEILAGIKSADRKFKRELFYIHTWAFVEIHLIIFGLMGALWVLHQVLIG